MKQSYVRQGPAMMFNQNGTDYPLVAGVYSTRSKALLAFEAEEDTIFDKVLGGLKELIDADGVYHGKTFDHDDMHIVCPWHGYEFHLADGTHVIDRRLRLQKFDVIERDGAVYVAA